MVNQQSKIDCHTLGHDIEEIIFKLAATDLATALQLVRTARRVQHW